MCASALSTRAWPAFRTRPAPSLNLILAKETVGSGKCLSINKERALQKNVLITNYTGNGAEQADESWKASGDTATNGGEKKTEIKHRNQSNH